MLGFSLGVDASMRHAPVDWWPQGVAAALDFRRGLYALPDVPDISTATETDLQTLRTVSFAEAVSISRASTATYVDASGQIQTAAADEPRFDWTHGKRQLLVEKAATNLFANPFAPTTQTVAVTDLTPYVLHVRGGGAVSLSGAATGTATQGAPVHFTASGTSLTCTVTGSLDAVQVEQMTVEGALSPTGSSFVDGVRADETCSLSQEFVDLINRDDVTILIQFGDIVDEDANHKRIVRFIDRWNYLGWRPSDGEARNNFPSGSKETVLSGRTVVQPNALSGAWDAAGRTVGAWNGNSGVVSSDFDGTGLAVADKFTLNDSTDSAEETFMWFDAIYVWPRRLSETELESVTRPYGV